MATELRHFEDLLEARLSGGLSGITGITAADIAWTNKSFTPTKGRPYLKPELSSRVRQPLGFGEDAVQEWTGTYQIGIFLPRDTGRRLGDQIASQLLALFPRGLDLQTTQGIWLIVTRGTVPVPVPSNDWILLPVIIDWFAHEP